MLQMSQVDLATAVGVSKQTIIDFERGARTPHNKNLLLIQGALEAAGIEFIPENGGGPGVRLRKPSSP